MENTYRITIFGTIRVLVHPQSMFALALKPFSIWGNYDKQEGALASFELDYNDQNIRMLNRLGLIKAD